MLMFTYVPVTYLGDIWDLAADTNLNAPRDIQLKQHL